MTTADRTPFVIAFIFPLRCIFLAQRQLEISYAHLGIRFEAWDLVSRGCATRNIPPLPPWLAVPMPLV